jgi:hypothetical protein
MGRLSTIKQLEPAVREQIASLRDRGVTIDQILAKLHELGEDHVSRSSLGRYIKEIEHVGERIRRSREIADALVRRLGEAPENRQAQLNIELMHTIIMDLVVGGEDGDAVTLDPEQAMFIGRALKDLASARKTDSEFILKIRQEAAKQASEAVDRVAKTRGLTADTVAVLKTEFLGIARK